MLETFLCARLRLAARNMSLNRADEQLVTKRVEVRMGFHDANFSVLWYNTPCMDDAKTTILVCGARSGAHLLEIAGREPDAKISAHVYDCHQARKIRQDLTAAGKADSFEVILAPYLPDGRMWDKGAFFKDDKSMSAELQLDCMQNLLAHVKGGENAKVAGIDKPTRRKVLSRKRNFAAEWPASVPGGEKLVFTSLPGCFCHRRADEGGLALAEVAARELAVSRRECKTTRILDMGCGAGFVGILVAKAIPSACLTLLDSHTRAVAAARINAERHDVQADFILSDIGTPQELNESFDVFLGNPPYYGNWLIADMFLATAQRALKPGGVCYTVAKSPRGLGEIQREFFGTVKTIPRRGYAVLKSVMRAEPQS